MSLVQLPDQLYPLNRNRAGSDPSSLPVKVRSCLHPDAVRLLSGCGTELPHTGNTGGAPSSSQPAAASQQQSCVQHARARSITREVAAEQPSTRAAFLQQLKVQLSNSFVSHTNSRARTSAAHKHTFNMASRISMIFMYKTWGSTRSWTHLRVPMSVTKHQLLSGLKSPQINEASQ